MRRPRATGGGGGTRDRNGTNLLRPGRGLDPAELLDGARRGAVLAEHGRMVAGSPVNLAQEVARGLEHAFRAGVAAARLDPGFDPAARAARVPRRLEPIDVAPRARGALATIKTFGSDFATGRMGAFLVRPDEGHPALPETDTLHTIHEGLTRTWGRSTTRTLVGMGFLAQAPGRPEGELTGTVRCLAYLDDGATSTEAPATAAWSWGDAPS